MNVAVDVWATQRARVLVMLAPRFAQRSDYRISESRVIRFRRVAHVGAV
jgi:hypothetical protein